MGSVESAEATAAFFNKILYPSPEQDVPSRERY